VVLVMVVGDGGDTNCQTKPHTKLKTVKTNHHSGRWEAPSQNHTQYMNTCVVAQQQQHFTSITSTRLVIGGGVVGGGLGQLADGALA